MNICSRRGREPLLNLAKFLFALIQKYSPSLFSATQVFLMIPSSCPSMRQSILALGIFEADSMPSSVLVIGLLIIEEQIFSVIAKLSSVFIDEQEITEGLDGV